MLMIGTRCSICSINLEEGLYYEVSNALLFVQSQNYLKLY